ncbi:MAG TPA: nicotinamide riboside transporter PnuC [Vicinamibacterales bacterium]|nr:nicotinamide riboside transporter PnuC [Vicinamibacterales bacterium]
MLEIIAVAFGLANIYLTVKQNVWCWPVGVVMVSVYIYIFFGARLYSDAMLNVFFLVMQFYGWYYWGKATDHARSIVPVVGLRLRGVVLTVAGILAGTAVLGTAMHTYTDAALPYPDAFTTMLSVFAQFLMTKKIIENWTLWIVADVVYVGVYAIKSLYWTCGLYVVFLVLCVEGYREWRRDLGAQPRWREGDSAVAAE